MAQVRGIGGIFFKSQDPEALYAWYEKHLGIVGKPGEGAIFSWRSAADPKVEQFTAWSIFPSTTSYFGKTNPAFMMNYIVDDLDGVLKELRAAGVAVDDKVEDYEYGKFGWLTDPEGNRIELWEPKAIAPAPTEVRDAVKP